MASYNKRISDQSKVKFNPINRELEDSENSELESRVDNLEENILGSKTATGNPITVTDAAPVNAVNISMDLEPIQAGSGTPSPDNIRPISGRSKVAIDRVGKNLFDISNADEGYIDGNGDFVSNAYFKTIKPIMIKPNNAYTLSYNRTAQASPKGMIFTWYNESGDFISQDYQNETQTAGEKTYTATSPLNAVYLRGTLYFESSYSEHHQLELGSTATTYQPFADKTYTIQLGDTVYGGTLDVTRGKMVVDRGYIASYNGETLPSTWISDRDVYASETSPTTGAQVVYELATPITIQLTPQQIKLLENTNTLYTDYEGDTIHIEYLLNNAIGELLGEVEDIYNKIDDIYNKIGSLDTRVTALEES